MKSRIALLASLLLLVIAPACRGDEGDDRVGLEGRITVAATNALRPSLTALGESFREEHPRTTIDFEFQAPASVVEEVTSGDPEPDVVALEEETATGLAALPRHTVFARNRMALAVAVGNSLGIASPADLRRAEVKVALCAPESPCGDTTAEVLALSHVPMPPHATAELNGRAVVSKVASGEADAGIAYATDIAAEGQRLAIVEIPADLNVSTAYAIAGFGSSTNPDLAKAFIAFVLSGEGQEILLSTGLSAP